MKVDTVKLYKIIGLCNNARSVVLTYNYTVSDEEKISLSTVYRYCKRVIHNFIRKSVVKILDEFTLIMNNVSIGKRAKNYIVTRIKKIFPNCYNCGENDMDVLQLHHIDWNRNNTKIDNLVVLCANCHVKVHKGSLVLGLENERKVA